MPRELEDYTRNCFEHNDPRAMVKVKNRDLKDSTLKKSQQRTVQRPKTPPLKQEEMFEGISGKTRKKYKRKAKKKSGYYYDK